MDLNIEYRHLLNGKVDKSKPRTLQAALRYFGLPEVEEKEYWHKVILSGGPFDADQKAGILKYCMDDVNAAAELLQAMTPKLPVDLTRVLLRGRYTVAVADTERRGIPIHGETWDTMLGNRETIQLALAQAVNRSVYPLYDEVGHFKFETFARWLADLGLAGKWKRTRRSRRLGIDDETLRHFSWHPAIERFRQARQMIQQLRKPPFEVLDGRNDFSIFPFQALTSRNSTKRCIFQAPRSLRGLVQPKLDKDLLHVDFEQEEFLIGGAPAGDDAVLRLYEAEDPYVSYGVRAGILPLGATKETHPLERERAKTMVLAVQFGMTPHGLAQRINVSLQEATELLKTHRRIFHRYWAWSAETVRRARWSESISPFMAGVYKRRRKPIDI